MPGGSDRVARDAEGSGEDVCGAAGDDAHRHRAAGEAVGHLVDGAVAPERDDDVVGPPGGLAGQLGGVAAAPRVDHVDLDAGGEGAFHEPDLSGRDRAGLHVGDEKEPHSAILGGSLRP